ncbi:unnamed protein product [Prorocentrum cordatum]|uniref:Uncharacterized protein n=1 Tax=Prorocentrum cordatum TaxID=2364126 RepID=A0ABN9UKG5_9DINO|nr:unnamed protein product [Polarella glacialis]
MAKILRVLSAHQLAPNATALVWAPGPSAPRACEAGRGGAPARGRARWLAPRRHLRRPTSAWTRSASCQVGMDLRADFVVCPRSFDEKLSRLCAQAAQTHGINFTTIHNDLGLPVKVEDCLLRNIEKIYWGWNNMNLRGSAHPAALQFGPRRGGAHPRASGREGGERHGQGRGRRARRRGEEAHLWLLGRTSS